MKTRFAPSPTGDLHIGNLRTALFAFLLAKAHPDGKFLLRIEDTDDKRSTSEFSDKLQSDLKWLELNWDEGPNRDNDDDNKKLDTKEGIKTLGEAKEREEEKISYFQSQRKTIYAHYYQQLEKNHEVYPCFCSPDQLLHSRQAQLKLGKPPRYEGTCRGLSSDQIQKKYHQGLKAALRFKVPLHKSIAFIDLIKGNQKFFSDTIGDFIIRREQGGAAFFFCNAIDDALMGVTHVLRGEDHLSNTPRQIILLQALNLPTPQYAHFPLILSSEGEPLSKRLGSLSLTALKEQGYLPAALQNYLARLGHSYSNNHLMTLVQLAENFSLKKVGVSPARLDIAQLGYWQKQAMHTISSQTLRNLLPGQVLDKISPNFIDQIKTNITFPKEIVEWGKIFAFSSLNYSDTIKAHLKSVPTAFWEELIASTKHHKAQYLLISQDLKIKFSLKGKALFTPLRLALTGRKDGPELTKIFEWLGVENLCERIRSMLSQLS